MRLLVNNECMKFNFVNSNAPSKDTPAQKRMFEYLDKLPPGDLIAVTDLANATSCSVDRIRNTSGWHPGFRAYSLIIKTRKYFGNKRTIVKAKRHFKQ